MFKDTFSYIRCYFHRVVWMDDKLKAILKLFVDDSCTKVHCPLRDFTDRSEGSFGYFSVF